jgi:DNA-binding CsgD family transcriptional regulator
MTGDPRPPEEGPSSRSAPARRRRGRPPHPDILTPREWQVLDLVRPDLTNEQIAGRLDISPATAKYHVSEILSKLGVQTREQAAAWQPPVPERDWWERVVSPLAAALRRVVYLTLPQAAIGAAALAALAGRRRSLPWRGSRFSRGRYDLVTARGPR